MKKRSVKFLLFAFVLSTLFLARDFFLSVGVDAFAKIYLPKEQFQNFSYEKARFGKKGIELCNVYLAKEGGQLFVEELTLSYDKGLKGKLFHPELRLEPGFFQGGHGFKMPLIPTVVENGIIEFVQEQGMRLYFTAKPRENRTYEIAISQDPTCEKDLLCKLGIYYANKKWQAKAQGNAIPSRFVGAAFALFDPKYGGLAQKVRGKLNFDADLFAKEGSLFAKGSVEGNQIAFPLEKSGFLVTVDKGDGKWQLEKGVFSYEGNFSKTDLLKKGGDRIFEGLQGNIAASGAHAKKLHAVGKVEKGAPLNIEVEEREALWHAQGSLGKTHFSFDQEKIHEWKVALDCVDAQSLELVQLFIPLLKKVSMEQGEMDAHFVAQMEKGECHKLNLSKIALRNTTGKVANVPFSLEFLSGKGALLLRDSIICETADLCFTALATNTPWGKVTKGTGTLVLLQDRFEKGEFTCLFDGAPLALSLTGDRSHPQGKCHLRTDLSQLLSAVFPSYPIEKKIVDAELLLKSEQENYLLIGKMRIDKEEVEFGSKISTWEIPREGWIRTKRFPPCLTKPFLHTIDPDLKLKGDFALFGKVEGEKIALLITGDSLALKHPDYALFIPQLGEAKDPLSLPEKSAAKIEGSLATGKWSASIPLKNATLCSRDYKIEHLNTLALWSDEERLFTEMSGHSMGIDFSGHCKLHEGEAELFLKEASGDLTELTPLLQKNYSLLPPLSGSIRGKEIALRLGSTIEIEKGSLEIFNGSVALAPGIFLEKLALLAHWDHGVQLEKFEGAIFDTPFACSPIDFRKSDAPFFVTNPQGEKLIEGKIGKEALTVQSAFGRAEIAFTPQGILDSAVVRGELPFFHEEGKLLYHARYKQGGAWNYEVQSEGTRYPIHLLGEKKGDVWCVNSLQIDTLKAHGDLWLNKGKIHFPKWEVENGSFYARISGKHHLLLGESTGKVEALKYSLPAYRNVQTTLFSEGDFSFSTATKQFEVKGDARIQTRSALSLQGETQHPVRFTYKDNQLGLEDLDLFLFDLKEEGCEAHLSAGKIQWNREDFSIAQGKLNLSKTLYSLLMPLFPEVEEKGVAYVGSEPLSADFNLEKGSAAIDFKGSALAFHGISISGGESRIKWDPKTLFALVHFEYEHLPLTAKFTLEKAPHFGGTFSLKEKDAQEGVTLSFSNDHKGKFTFEKLKGNFLGSELSFEKSHAQMRANGTCLRGEVKMNARKLALLLPENVKEAMISWNLGKGYLAKGELFLPHTFENSFQFVGDLRGEKVQTGSIIWKHVKSGFDFSPDHIELKKVSFFDPSGQVEMEKVVCTKKEGKWRLAIPSLQAFSLLPSLWQKKGGALAIERFSLANIEGNLAELDSLRGEGFLFFRKEQREKGIFELPLEKVRELGLDPRELFPSEGEAKVTLRGGRLTFSELRNAYSEGRHSQFFFSAKDPAYIKLNGEMAIDLKLKQRAVFKFAEPFTISIRGDLAQPKVTLRR